MKRFLFTCILVFLASKVSAISPDKDCYDAHDVTAATGSCLVYPAADEVIPPEFTFRALNCRGDFYGDGGENKGISSAEISGNKIAWKMVKGDTHENDGFYPLLKGTYYYGGNTYFKYAIGAKSDREEGLILVDKKLFSADRVRNDEDRIFLTSEKQLKELAREKDRVRADSEKERSYCKVGCYHEYTLPNEYVPNSDKYMGKKYWCREKEEDFVLHQTQRTNEKLLKDEQKGLR